jgi:osmotically-inducible protein OsmY
MHTFSKFLSISILAAFITGCIPVAIVGAGAAAGTMLGRDSRSLQTISDDTDIQFQVDQALRKDKAIHEQANISNITFNHIVLLVGEAPSA